MFEAMYKQCSECERLNSEVADALKTLCKLTTASLKAFQAKDQKTFSKLDKELELALGVKERIIGAQRQHKREHANHEQAA
jgi:hypothetical protein